MEKSILTLLAVLLTVAVLHLQGRYSVKRLTSNPSRGGVRFPERIFDYDLAEARPPKYSFAMTLGQEWGLVMQSAFGHSRRREDKK